MEIIEVMRDRHSVRQYTDQKIEDVIASTEELFESLTIPTYIYVP